MYESEVALLLTYNGFRVFSTFSANRTAGAVILRISHGYEVKEHNDPFVELADQATEQFSLATAPGGFLVDLIPTCMA